MRHHPPLVILLAFCCLPAHAVTVYQCREADGSVAFYDRCPPGTEQLSERHLSSGARRGGPDLQDIAAEHPVVLYSVPDCDACDLVRAHLSRRNIPFEERNVADDVARQEELRQSAGKLTVPVVTLDGKAITGYNRFALDAALDAAGYPNPQTGAAPAPGGEAEPTT